MALYVRTCVETVDGNLDRYFAKDDQGWHTTQKEKSKEFPSMREAEDALLAIRMTYPELAIEIVG